MEKAQAKGELNEEDLRALEMDVTGKVGAYFFIKKPSTKPDTRSCWRLGEAQGLRSSKFCGKL